MTETGTNRTGGGGPDARPDAVPGDRPGRRPGAGTARLAALGLLAALFFSSTFVLNRAMSLSGGHWVWTAALRYGWTILLLVLWLPASGRAGLMREVLAEYRRHPGFWTLAGAVGCGLFYAPLCFSAQYAPGWVAASTWQATILASPLVLRAFGRRAPTAGVFLVLAIFAGIVCINAGQLLLDAAAGAAAGSAGGLGLRELALGVLPVLVAAFAYPCGNQLVWEARHGDGGRLPRIESPALDQGLGAVLLLALGSAPFWVGLVVLAGPPPPPAGQVANTGLVALLSGVVATSLFLDARRRARTPAQILTVDATQAGETLFTLAGELAILGGALPGPLGWLGVALVTGGLVLSATRRGS
jgi:drug/metabolite transporter (DMT)-like permease